MNAFFLNKNRIQCGIIGYHLSFILFSFLIFTTQQTAWGLEKTKGSEYDNSHANPKILKGINLLYNLQFDDAEDLFNEVIAESPNKPAGYFYLTMVTWSRMVAGFWSPETVEEYKQRTDRTVSVANKRIKNNVANSYDYFYLGGALGFLGRFELMRAEWLSSFLTAKKAIKALKTCKKMDPNNRDVLLGLGIFDYYTARLSGVLKFLSYLLLHKGNKEKGLRKLHTAAEKAIYSGVEAKSVLLHIYLFLEEECSKAPALARELGEKYPQDPTYKLFEGTAYVRLGLWQKYNGVLSYMRERSLQAPQKKEDLIWQRRLLYLQSIHDLFHSHYPEARSKLQEILTLSDPVNDPAMIAWPIVKIGMAYDLEGDRKTAVKYYQKVLDMKNGSGAQFMAEKCLDEPPQGKDPIIGY